jgi:hypothetical protein
MRKISLDVDALKVESFDTAERGAEKRGTVRANATGIRTHCDDCLSGPYPCEQSYAIHRRRGGLPLRRRNDVLHQLTGRADTSTPNERVRR